MEGENGSKHTYIQHTHTHTYIHTYIHTHTHTHTHTHIHTHTNTHTHTHFGILLVDFEELPKNVLSLFFQFFHFFDCPILLTGISKKKRSQERERKKTI